MPVWHLKSTMAKKDKKNVCKNMSTQTEPSVEELAVHLQFQPVYPELFREALTHSSYSNEHKIKSNERLEFLGDSVLSLIVASFLYGKFPEYNEGRLAKLKSIIVSAPVLASFSKQLCLDEYIKLGAGELRNNGNTKSNILADLFEAFIGAYFLNYGLDKTTSFVEPLINSNLEELNLQSVLFNAKNNLQEYTQSKGMVLQYRTVKEEGPPHERWFTVEVLVNNQPVGSGAGRSIKEAQNKAALEAINEIK